MHDHRESHYKHRALQILVQSSQYSNIRTVIYLALTTSLNRFS